MQIQIYLFMVFIFIMQNMIPIFLSSEYTNLVLGMLLLLSSPKGKTYLPDRQLVLWHLAFMCFIFVSSFWSISPKITYFALILRVFPIFCFVLTLSRFLNNYKNLFRLLRIYYFASVILLLFFVFFVNLSSIGDERISVGEGLKKEWNINSVAMELAIAIYVGYILFWKSKRNFLRMAWLLISAAMLFIILVTGSRKGLFFLIIPVAVYSLFELKGHLLYAAGLIAAGIASVYAIMNVPFLYDLMGWRIHDMLDVIAGTNDHTQDDSRMLLILAGWEWFLENPLHGYGMNCFRVLSDSNILFMGKNWYAHNNYIEILVGGGIIGFLFYYSYLVLVVKRIWGHFNPPYKVAIILLAVLLFADTAQVAYYNPDLQFMILIVFTILKIEEKRRSLCTPDVKIVRK